MTTHLIQIIAQVIDMAKFDAYQDFELGERQLSQEKHTAIDTVSPLILSAPALLDLCRLWEFLVSNYVDTTNEPLFNIALSMTKATIKKAEG